MHPRIVRFVDITPSNEWSFLKLHYGAIENLSLTVLQKNIDPGS